MINPKLRCTYFGLLFILSIVFTHGQSRQELELKKSNTRAEINRTNKIIKEISKNKSISLNKIRLWNKQVGNRRELIDNLDYELAELSIIILDNEFVVKSMGEDITRIKNEYGKLLQSVYNQRPPFFELIYLFSSENLNQAYKRTLYLRQYSQYRQKQVHLLIQMQTLFELKTDELKFQKEKMEEIIGEYQLEKSNLDSDIGMQRGYYVQLQSKESKLRRELRKNEEITRRLDLEIARILDEEARKLKSIYKLTPNEKLISEEFIQNKGKLPWPTRTGVITGKFGIHPHPIMKNIKIDNGGIDIATTGGSKVRSIFNGEVMKIIAILGANQTVIIRHGNFLTVYRNLIDVTVKVGEKVVTLQEIGTVFTDHLEGEDTTLHFRIYNEKKGLNPELWLGR